MDIEKILLVMFIAPLILVIWCLVFCLIDGTFFNGLFVKKIQLWSRKKFEKED